MTPRMEKVRNCALMAGAPFLTTVHSSQTSGTMATPKAIHTTPVTKRSTAARRFSTAADHSGMPTR